MRDNSIVIQGAEARVLDALGGHFLTRRIPPDVTHYTTLLVISNMAGARLPIKETSAVMNGTDGLNWMEQAESTYPFHAIGANVLLGLGLHLEHLESRMGTGVKTYLLGVGRHAYSCAAEVPRYNSTSRGIWGYLTLDLARVCEALQEARDEHFPGMQFQDPHEHLIIDWSQSHQA